MQPSVATPPSPPQDPEHLRETERARLRALVSADIDLARKYHAPDFQLITPIGATLSKEEYLGAIAAGQIKYVVWNPAEITVRLYGAFAVIRYQAQLEVIFGGHKVPRSDYWHTDTYEYQNGQWMAVWSHATAIK